MSLTKQDIGTFALDFLHALDIDEAETTGEEHSYVECAIVIGYRDSTGKANIAVKTTGDDSYGNLALLQAAVGIEATS